MTLSSVIREDPCEFLGAITSFVTFLSDLLTDLTVAGFYFYYGHLNWGLLTLLLIFVPGMIHITSLLRHYYVITHNFRLDYLVLFIILAERRQKADIMANVSDAFALSRPLVEILSYLTSSYL